MVHISPHLQLGVSRRYDMGFGVGAIAMFSVGLLLLDFAPYDRRAILVAILLLLVTSVLTGVQAVTNGSSLLGVVLSVAFPLGVWVRLAYPGLNTLQLALTLGLAFGMSGHVSGVAIARRRDSATAASDRELLVVGGLFVVIAAAFFARTLLR